jgi:precorrin-6B methylase 2
MTRMRWTLVLSILAAAIIAAAHGCHQKVDSGKAVTLTLLLPQSDAVVFVNDVEALGQGVERKLKVRLDPGEDKLRIVARFYANDYTKITRPRLVKIVSSAVTVDFREPSEIEQDDIYIRYLPTPDDVVDAMCELAKVGEDDVVYDLGCGDGRLVFAAVQRFGAKRGVGIDMLADMIKECKKQAASAGIKDRTEFRVGNVLEIEDLSQASVVFLYMGDDINARLKPILKSTMKPGSRIVSHRFLMGDDWRPDKTVTVASTQGDFLIHLWTIKAKTPRRPG